MSTVLGANIYATLTDQHFIVQQAGEEVMAPHPHTAHTDTTIATDERATAAFDLLRAGATAVAFNNPPVDVTHQLDSYTTVTELTIPRPSGALRLSIFSAPDGRTKAAQIAGRTTTGQFVDVYCTDRRLTKLFDPVLAAQRAGGLV